MLQRSVRTGRDYAIKIRFLIFTLLGFGIFGLPDYYHYKM